MSRRTGRCPDFAAILRTTSPDVAVRDQVVECFYEELRRLAAIRCRDNSLAEDAAQDAVATSLVALASFRGEGKVEHWLRRLVNTSCSRLRSGRKNSPAWNRPLDDLPAHYEADPEQETQEIRVMVNERLEILREVLEDVAEPNRSLLLLHEGQELSIAELAERFGMTEDGVKGRLKRTRFAVREKLLAAADQDVPD